MIYDIETFAAIQGEQGNLVESVGAGFGVPRCILDMTNDLLKLLPSSVLNAAGGASKEAEKKANDKIKQITNAVFLETGIIEFDTETGQFVFMTDASNQNREGEGGSLMDKLGGFMGALNGYLTVGGNLYNNYLTRKAQIESIAECIDGFSKVIRYGGGNSVKERNYYLTPEESQALIQTKYSSEIAEVKDLQVFIERAADLQNNINGILTSRRLDPSLEPVFDKKWEDLIGDHFLVQKDPDEEPDAPVFRLIFGPPKSVKGQFLLSVDGLYFDSQKEDGLELALGELKRRQTTLKDGDRWKFDYDPNLGGKGVAISNDDLREYVGTIFDPNLIDNSSHIQEYYDKDGFLAVLLEQRDKKISDMEQQIIELSDTQGSLAIIDNTKQALLSEQALMDDKVNRRKKQIEIAVKAPSIYGKGARFSKGNIPINDFSYLRELNIAVALSKQQRLVLSQVDISGVVLPLKPEFVVATENREFTTFDNLLVPPVGLGEVVYDTSNVSATIGVPYAVTDSVVKKNLIGLFNFLDSEVVDPSSPLFLINNSSEESDYNNCQIVSKEASTVFTKGLGVPFFEGVTKHQASSLDPYQASAVGGFARLPDTTEFKDLMYGKKGFTIDLWTHVPTLMDPEHGWLDNGVSSQHRLLLANENVGIASGINPQASVTRMLLDQGDSVVRGFVMGFTRDNRIVTNSEPSNETTVNTSAGLGFYLAATQSFDSSSAGFISSGAGVCPSGPGWNNWSMNVTSTVNGLRFMDVAKEYMNITLTVAPEEGEVKVYLDSTLMATSSITAVFGSPNNEPPKLPSFYKDNSFEYSGINVGSSAGVDLGAGPRLNPFFTPWIVGGGYTDGFASGAASGNFMGGKYGGVRSGLRGHMGGMKFYTRPLDPVEINQNFNAQKSFFKNVRTVDNLTGRLFLLLGGENCAGQAMLSSIPDINSAYSSVKYDNVFVWNNRTSPDRIWENLEAGYNNKSYDTSWGAQTKFGPELSLASALSVQYPNENIYIAKMGVSGSYLEPSAGGSYSGVERSDWSTTSLAADASGNLFNMIFSSTGDSGLSKVQGLAVTGEGEPFLKARGNDLLQVCGIFYINGESDALGKPTVGNTAAADFDQNIQDFAYRLRHQLTATNWVDSTSIPFVQTVIHEDTDGQGTATIRATQLSVTGDIELAANVDLSAFTLEDNNRDLDASSLIELGDALVTSYLTIL